MTVELIVPKLGESIAEAQISHWLKSPGDQVQADEPVVEIETDKASMQLPSPAAGRIARLLKQEGESAKIGEALAEIEELAAPAPAQAKDEAKKRPDETKQAPAPIAPSARSSPGAERAAAKAQGPRQEEAVPMSPMRRAIARRLVEARQTAALLTTFNEIDMSAVVALRQRLQQAFQEERGVKLGFMSFFVKACVEALRRVPQLNARIRGDSIVYFNYCDIGIAIAAPAGLAVPVLRNAERMSFAEIETAIDDFARRAQEKKLTLEELAGGTFTISNGGVYGSLLSTPLVNPPQSGVLGMHAIQDRPVALDGQVVIRPMMYVALTYDHRLVDGREAVAFLRRVKEVIEQPARMLLEI